MIPQKLLRLDWQKCLSDFFAINARTKIGKRFIKLKLNFPV